MNGLIIVDKPVGCTSFDMVAKMRKEYNEKKVGHIGTLDPMASGVLPILLGEATKLSDFLMLHDKEYIATLKLGTKMDTGDSEGKAIEESEIPDLKSLNLHEILNNFLGKQMQIPPMYSAIKVNGRKLYELAREGKSIEIPAREIEIFDIEILNVNYEFKEIEFRVVCSKGTYIRVLCEDIAKSIGTCGYMKALRRTRVGKFKIEDAGKLIEFKDILDVKNISLNDIKTESMEITMKKVLNGVPIAINEPDGLVNLYKDDSFIGIGDVKNKMLKRKIIIK